LRERKKGMSLPRRKRRQTVSSHWKDAQSSARRSHGNVPEKHEEEKWMNEKKKEKKTSERAHS
jgi:hypothetical protein